MWFCFSTMTMLFFCTGLAISLKIVRGYSQIAAPGKRPAAPRHRYLIVILSLSGLRPAGMNFA